MSTRRKAWPADVLADQLRKLGVESGDKLFVHTSLRVMRLCRDDVPRLLEAYLDVLGPEGALYVPTHTYSFKGLPGAPVYTIDTPSHFTIGAWPEYVRRLPEARRSYHPTHSCAGIGAGVGEIVADHEQRQPVGLDSPLDRLQQLGAKVLLIGCGFEACTLVHLAEHYAEVPYLGLYPSDYDEPYGVLRRGAAFADIPITERPGCSQGFTKLEPGLRERGVIRDGMLGLARVMVCDMPDLLAAAVELFRARPLGYLCDTQCLRCTRVRHEYPDLA
jgi:aminoglycoside 3-N-acetyltransferase